MVALPDKLFRTVININGIVQGVGFRPFVYNLAHTCGLRGWVNNFPGGVHIDAEGSEESLERFICRLKNEAPPLAVIDTFQVSRAEPAGYTDFEIRESSDDSAHDVYISGDISVCPDCLREMNDPGDRRYKYPFLSCTNCGPRFTITTGIPYDRANTTMRVFPMCASCAKEYHDPADRRFHAQPTACPSCGPSLSLLDSDGNRLAESSELVTAIKLLEAGKIIAVKGLGGYHLACDAENSAAVRELRARKNRDGKPFALMAKSIETVRKYCFVSEKESDILQSVKKPIVLLDKKPASGLACDAISQDNNKIGIMLPYTPVHHLLFDGSLALLVMTSGNRSGEPIYYKDQEALGGLRGIADYFLTNNREIYIRTDDSVTSVWGDREYIIRRSRGYVPSPIGISSVREGQRYPSDRVPSVLACGGELKNTFCLTKGHKAFLSHHIGDLENAETLRSFETGIDHFKKIFSIEPEAAAFDKHPGYLSTQYAEKLDSVLKIPVQHHHAHIASCMAENGVAGKVIGVAFDGTGFGDDGRIWGGEFFAGDYLDFDRLAHFEYVPLPGGDTGIREPWRMALSYLSAASGAASVPELPFLRQIDRNTKDIVLRQIEKQINAPLTSSAGRLFDAVSSMIGLCNVIDYEGQAAIRLEKYADSSENRLYPFDIVPEGAGYRIVVRDMIEAIAADVRRGRDVPGMSGAFHRTSAQIILEVCRLLREQTGLNRTVLSGGVFQNRLLLGLTLDLLEKSGFQVYIHSKVPANDGGIALGQAAIALKKLAEKGRSNACE